MRETQDRDVVALARELSRLTADPADARDAISAVRLQLKARAPAPHSRTFRALFLGGGIAAALALACGAWVLFQPRPLSAAEALQASTQATEAYRGWVHLAPEGGAPYLMEVNQGIQLKLKGMHFNTIDGTSAIVYEIQGKPLDALPHPTTGLVVQMVRPDIKKQFLYTGATDELRILPANKTWGSPISLPLNLAGVLAQIKSASAGVPDVKQSMDKDLERFDLTYRTSATTPPPHERREAVWVDPKTRLIRKMAAQLQSSATEGPLVMEYTYGDPIIRDVYDLGVPHTAHITGESIETPPDGPPVAKMPNLAALVKDDTQDAAPIVARLKIRMDKDFGNFVELQCEQTRFLHHNRPEEGSMTLIAKDGNKAVSAHYLVAPLEVTFGGPGFPKGWPLPALDDALGVMKTAMPVRMEVLNGASSLQGENQPNGQFAIKPDARPEQLCKMGFQLGPTFWTLPQTVSMIKDGKEMVDRHVEVLRDPARTGLIVLHAEERASFPLTPSQANYHADVFVWVFPAYNDLVVESLQRTNGKTDAFESYIHTVLLEFDQLKDGTHFPSHWQYMCGRLSEPGVEDDGYVELWRQFFDENSLPPEWYEDPTPRLSKIRPLFIPSSQPQSSSAPAATSLQP